MSPLPETRKPQTDARALALALRRHIAGEVRFDAGSRALYATDGSNYRQVPIGIVLPRSTGDVQATLALCREHGAPVLSRGGGTSLAGQCCNVAVVMDWTKYLNRVLEVDPERRVARVEPGTVLDDLRAAAGKHDLTFGPDPATHTHCTVGGMLGNNSCGVHSQMAGKTVDNTEELEVLTYDGVRLRAGWMEETQLERGIREGGRKGQILEGVKTLRERYGNLIRARYPSIPRRVSGYNLDELLPDAHGRFNLGRALVGSEGTLVTILGATVRLLPAPKQRSLVVIGFHDIYRAADAVPEVVTHHPIGLEGMDELLVENMKKKGLHVQHLKLLPEGKGWLLVEFGADTKGEADAQARTLMEKVRSSGIARDMKLYDDAEEERHVWETRESALGATAFVPGEPVTWEGWEDSAVPPEKLGAYLRDLCRLYEQYGYKGALYGHFGQGCVHTRISFDLTSAPGVKKFRAFVEDAAALVVSYGGSLSGEHGDGQSRAELLEKMFGPELVRAFREFKALWDPENGMNPGKVVDPYRLDENLRLGADYRPRAPLTVFQFPDDQGSFANAALRCVGVGKCRRGSGIVGDDVMCPSYMVTREEMHTTRGRAHLLWEMLQGDVIHDGWRDEHVKEALDLCLSCKGCKGDCPVAVDIATYKAEFLHHYWKRRLRPRHAYAFALVDQWARLASLWPGLVNLVTQTPLLRRAAQLAADMPKERAIPAFAPQTFQAWFRRRPAPRSGSQGRVLLWPDTFNNHFFPGTARAAVDVLEHHGFEVMVPSQHVCCGRPLYDYGMLDLAKAYLERVMKALRAQIEAGTPIVVLEPSCASVFRDELRGLFPEDALAQKLRKQTWLLSDFLHQHAPTDGAVHGRGRALVQGHCHQKSIMKSESEKELLQRLGLEVEVLASSCCGMAGSFGFEREKYAVSKAIAEYALLPRVRAAAPETLIVADGFSCREQIRQFTGREALHLAEVLQMAQRNELAIADTADPL